MKNLLYHLKLLNFSQYESMAYLSLLQQGRVTGYELSKNSGIPASKIYAVLSKLIEKEVILALDSDPIRYTPIPPNEIVGRFKGNYQRTFDTLTQELNKIYRSDSNDDHYIWNLSGRHEIMAKISEFLNQSLNSLYLSVWDEELLDFKASLLQVHQRGVEISVVHYGHEVLGFGREYRHGREHQIRQQRGARRIALEIDDDKVILAHFTENGGSHALWTKSKGIVLLAKDYIIHDIYTIRMAEKFGEAAMEIFESH
jgi:sugar-specific transcriptional regulator TrmB